MGLWRRLSILPTIALRGRKALREPDLFLEPSYSRGVHTLSLSLSFACGDSEWLRNIKAPKTIRTAEHHEHAAHHHREAAKHHESGAHEKAGHHAHIAHGHASHARHYAEEASKHHAQEHGSKK